MENVKRQTGFDGINGNRYLYNAAVIHVFFHSELLYASYLKAVLLLAIINYRIS
jgi:hypothetical protein